MYIPVKSLPAIFFELSEKWEPFCRIGAGKLKRRDSSRRMEVPRARFDGKFPGWRAEKWRARRRSAATRRVPSRRLHGEHVLARLVTTRHARVSRTALYTSPLRLAHTKQPVGIVRQPLKRSFAKQRERASWRAHTVPWLINLTTVLFNRRQLRGRVGRAVPFHEQLNGQRHWVA